MMNNRMLKYDGYKESGEEWIGKTPLRWKITRNKDIFEERGSLSYSGQETLLTVSHITGVTRREEKNVNMFMAETMEGYKVCEKGDLIINTMWAWMGALGTSNEKGICSPAYGVYKPRKNKDYYHRYFDYLYRTPMAITEMTRYSKGIVSSRLRLYSKEFFQIKTPLPDYEVQKSIADYLDIKTSQIDQKIELLTKKSKKYGELKQSLINETVTRGLDKTVSMKDSGIEWIGEVPEHWEIKRLKDYYTSSMGNTILQSELVDGGTIPVYSATAEDKYFGYVNNANLILNKNDLIIPARGNSIGCVKLVKEKCTATQTTIACKIRQQILTKYIYYFLVGNKHSIFKFDVTAIPQFTVEDTNFINILYPPIDEQKSIAEYLEIKTSHIDKIIKTINIQIEKLKELRKTLINDVVTGKIKVCKEV